MYRRDTRKRASGFNQDDLFELLNSPKVRIPILAALLALTIWLEFGPNRQEQAPASGKAALTFDETSKETKIDLFPFVQGDLSQLIGLRQQNALAHREFLVNGSYSPSEQLIDPTTRALNVPMISVAEAFFVSPPTSSMRGAAVTSELLNPFLLIKLRFIGSLSDPKTRSKISADDADLVANYRISPQLEESSLVYKPEQREVEISYVFDGNYEFLVNQMHSDKDFPFSVSFVNARDFGFRFAAIDAECTTKVGFKPAATNPTPLTGAEIEPMSELILKRRQATLCIKLWAGDPSQPPEVTVKASTQ